MLSRSLSLVLLAFSFLSYSPLHADELEKNLSALKSTNQTIEFNGIKRAIYLPCTLLVYLAATLKSDAINYGAFMTAGAFVIGHEIWLRQNSEARQLRAIRRRFQNDVVQSLYDFEAQLLHDIELLFQGLRLPIEDGATLSDFAQGMKAFNLEWVGIDAAPKIFDALEGEEKKALWETVLSIRNRCETWREAESLTRPVGKLRGNYDVASIKLLAKELNKLSNALWSRSYFRN